MAIAPQRLYSHNYPDCAKHTNNFDYSGAFAFDWFAFLITRHVRDRNADEITGFHIEILRETPAHDP